MDDSYSFTAGQEIFSQGFSLVTIPVLSFANFQDGVSEYLVQPVGIKVNGDSYLGMVQSF